MIKHIVMWKLKDFAEGADKKENAGKIKSLLEGLRGKISGMHCIEVGVNFIDSPIAWDIALYAEFENMEALKVYQNYPEHVNAGDFVSKVRLERCAVDYEV
jgi:hypothetical protein